MKLEFLPASSPDCPLLRLFDFTAAEAEKLLAAISGLASGVSESVMIHLLPFVEAIDGCQLTLRVSGWDRGVSRLAEPANFECGFTVETWDNVAGLVEPFATRPGGFQWLAGVPGEAKLVFGDW